jgi:hypothetical protein
MGCRDMHIFCSAVWTDVQLVANNGIALAPWHAACASSVNARGVSCAVLNCGLELFTGAVICPARRCLQVLLT